MVLNKTLTILKHCSSPIRTLYQKIILVKIARRANISGSGWQNKEIRTLDWKFQQFIPFIPQEAIKDKEINRTYKRQRG